MQQNKSFVLRKIANVPYLLPYGQMIADHKRGMRINDTGVYLWSLMAQDRSMAELLSLSAEYYEITTSEMAEFQTDIRQFVNQLIAYGIVVDDSTDIVDSSLDSLYLSIAGLNIQLSGPSESFPKEFTPFVVSECEMLHQRVFLKIGTPPLHQNGRLLIRNPELFVLETDEEYILLFPMSQHIHEIQLKKDGSLATCYCIPPYNENFHYDIFHALRLVYLYLAQKKGMVALHSASLLYHGRAWLFSGHSGIGKSTHTNLWKELYEITLLNGDLNLLSIDHGCPVIHGIPWCGTSEICSTETYPLGGIILLNQAPSDTIEKLSSDRKQLLVSQRLISPAWTVPLFEHNMDIVAHIVPQILVCKLHCTKDPSAAKVMKTYIDDYLSNPR